MALVLAFAESVLWGLGCLLLWPAVLIGFVVTYWPRTRIPAVLHFTGLVIAVVGATASGMERMRGLVMERQSGTRPRTHGWQNPEIHRIPENPGGARADPAP